MYYGRVVHITANNASDSAYICVLDFTGICRNSVTTVQNGSLGSREQTKRVKRVIILMLV